MRARAGALCLLLLGAPACERKRSLQSKLTTASATGSGQVLDGMQLDSARRVALESAKEAMEARNGERLQQLRKWVEGRASVPVFPHDDLAALDLAIACLEQPEPPADLEEQLEQAKTSKLAESARRACER
jgi:hypothetical protein